LEKDTRKFDRATPRTGAAVGARHSDTHLQQAPLKFTIPSVLGASRDVQQQIMEAVHRHGYSEEAAFGIKLSLEEALVNAIKHGNKLDPRKHVRVTAEVTARHVEIIIQDEGPGFDRTCVPDPTADENLTKCSGRGLLLMEAYMTSVEYSDNGRRVRLYKVKD
jgi:serine/threonine-protein kinase RsbW